MIERPPPAASTHAQPGPGGTIIHGPDVSLRQCPSGPLLVRGAHNVVDATGRAHAVSRPVVALCACDKSGRRPWCDATHKSIPDY